MERLHGYRSHVSEEDMAMYEEGFFGYAAASVYAAPEKSKGEFSVTTIELCRKFTFFLPS